MQGVLALVYDNSTLLSHRKHLFFCNCGHPLFGAPDSRHKDTGSVDSAKDMCKAFKPALTVRSPTVHEAELRYQTIDVTMIEWNQPRRMAHRQEPRCPSCKRRTAAVGRIRIRTARGRRQQGPQPHPQTPQRGPGTPHKVPFREVCPPKHCKGKGRARSRAKTSNQRPPS